MGAIKAIVDAVASTIKNTIEGVSQAAGSAGKMDLKGTTDGICQAMGLAGDDAGNQSASAAQASNTLMERELARMQGMLAQNNANQQNSGNGGNGDAQSFGGMRA